LVVQTSKNDIVILSSDVTDVVVRRILLITACLLCVYSDDVCPCLQILDSIPKDTKNRVWILLQFKEYVPVIVQGMLAHCDYVYMVILQ
jgi:hypothetical protein